MPSGEDSEDEGEDGSEVNSEDEGESGSEGEDDDEEDEHAAKVGNVQELLTGTATRTSLQDCCRLRQGFGLYRMRLV